MIATIIIIYFVFLFDFKITYSKKNQVYEIEYSGLLWVALDYYMIPKYNSNDKPMSWLKWNKVEQNN